MPRRPVLFKWRRFEPQTILCAVRWYLRFSSSYRDVEELLRERGINVDHLTLWRWVQRFAPELDLRQRQHLKPANMSWRADETYILSAFRDVDAAKSLVSPGAPQTTLTANPESSTPIW